MHKAAFFALLLASFASLGKQTNTQHTFKLGKASPPPAEISAASMLVGAWHGEGFGQRLEETWNPPSAGTMVGMFKVFDEEKGVSFYELMLIEQVENSLVLKVKHFGADFSGWEKQDEFVSFPLVEAGQDRLLFEGLSFYRNGLDGIDVYVAISGKAGVSEQKLIYKRID